MASILLQLLTLTLELLARFVIGGALVSTFSLVADGLRPKTLAGVLGAAPSVALATLGLAFVTKDSNYVIVEAWSMILAVVAFACYSAVVASFLMRKAGPTHIVTAFALLVWFGVAFGLAVLFAT